jgi:CRISPR-associated endoribonuclease Cas6
VVSRWLDSDHRAAIKPYAISPPMTRGAKTVLQVRLLDDGLVGRLTSAASPGARVRLGRHHFTVAEPPRMLEAAGWADLMCPQVRAPRAWQLRFDTPTTFRRRDRSTPWLAPESVLRSLADRWRALDFESAPSVSPQQFRSLWVSDLDGHSVTVRRAGLLVSGFVGRIRYVCDGSAVDAAAADALFRFGAYAGVGSHTAFGFGVVSTEATWQPGGTPAEVATGTG